MARYLLDTHIFVWVNNDVRKIPQSILSELGNPNNEFFISMVSLWEIQIKLQLGKFQDIPPLNKLIQQIYADNIYTILPIKPSHLLALEPLPFIHKDPFDRLLIAQAITENLTMMSVDEHFPSYPVKLLK